MTTLIRDTLTSVEVGLPRVHRNLVAFPLVGPSLADPGYVTLDEALARGVIVISELTESGSVPELKVVNQGDVAVLLVDGEELVGAKQNRVLNLTVLVPPGKTTVISVSCVEAGRWAWREERFAASPRAHYARGRAQRLDHVTESLRATGEARSDQGAVWDDIALKAAALGASSDTSAMADIFEQHEGTMEAFVEALATPVAPNQSGVAFALDGRLAGVDLFDAAEFAGGSQVLDVYPILYKQGPEAALLDRLLTIGVASVPGGSAPRSGTRSVAGAGRGVATRLEANA